MDEAELLPELKKRMRQYFNGCQVIKRDEYYQDLYGLMSVQMRGEVALFLNATWIQAIPFFQCKDMKEQEQFIAEVSFKLKLKAFAPWEMIINEGVRMEEMYIIRKGLVGYKGLPMSKGRFFGEDMIASLLLRDLRSDKRAMALTFVETSTLACTDLFEIMETGRFKHIRRKIRKEALKQALCKTILGISKVSERQGASGGRGARGGRKTTDKSTRCIQYSPSIRYG